MMYKNCVIVANEVHFQSHNISAALAHSLWLKSLGLKIVSSLEYLSHSNFQKRKIVSGKLYEDMLHSNFTYSPML